MDARLRFVQKRPVPRRVGKRVVSSIHITRDAVTPVELAPDSVTPDAIAPDAVTSDALAPDSVTADAIAPGSITDTELAPDAGGADTTFSGSAPVNPSIGDVWFDSSDSLKLKRWSGTAWVSMRDIGIAAAQAGADAASTAATAAQTTANSKNKVYRQTSEPTGGTYAEGDLWFDTDDNNKIYRRTSSAWTAVQLGGEALANINANKITAGSIDASVITVSNLDAGNITAGTIAASRITSTSISAANITAAQITSGAISSARITSDSISAADINADRITAGRMNAGDVLIGNDIVAGGHYGISLSSSDFNNIFLRRSDGVYFFRVGAGLSNSIQFDSSSGLVIAGTITGASRIDVGTSTSNGFMSLRSDSYTIVNGIKFQSRQYAGWANSFYPYYDATYDLGVRAADYRWDNMYYTGSLFDSSDRRIKNSIEDSNLGLEFIEKLKPVSYYKNVSKKHPIEIPLEEGQDGEPEVERDEDGNPIYTTTPGKRRHYGLIAQDVQESLTECGVDPSNFSGWALVDPNDPNSEQSLAYIKFIAPMIKAIQELSAKVKELESNQ